MKVLIDIDNEYLEIVRHQVEHGDDFLPFKIIAKGTPLPKGHGRLIDADAVLSDPFGDTYKDIDAAETIIEADNAESEGY